MTWNRIQSAKGAAFGTTAAATFAAANVSAGNKIIAVVGSSWRDPPTGVSDGTNSWTLLGSRLPASNGGSVWLYGLDVPAGDAGTKPTITATFPSSNGQSIVIQEVAGLLPGNTTAMIDGTPAGLAGTGAATGSPAYSSTTAGEYLVCAYGDANSAATLAAAAGLTLDPNNAVTQSFASIEYGNSTGGAEVTGFTGASTGQWSVLAVAFKLAAQPAPAATPPPIIPPHPAFTDMLLGEAYQRADWQAQGVADLTVSFASTSGGVDTYNVSSPWNNPGGIGTQQMRVLAPTAAANLNYPHAFLVMLPVDANQGTSFGDSIAVAQAVTANDTWNLTVVQPGYGGPLGGSIGPWFGDNPLDPTISQEKYTLLITAWIRKNLAVTGTEKVYLIGFSRSGLAAQFLQFRHPHLFSAAASWDSPFEMTDYDGTDPNGHVGGGSDAVFGTSANFQSNYRLSAAHLGFWQATGQYAVNRIWVGQGPDFGDSPQYDAALAAAGIPHTYNFSNTVETHAWHADWVAAALASIIPSSYAQAATVLPQQVPRPLLTELLAIAAWRTPAAAPPPVTAVTATGNATFAGTAAPAAAPVNAAGALAVTGTAAGAAPAAAAGGVTVAGTAAAAAPATAAGSVIFNGTATAAGNGAAAATGALAVTGTAAAGAAAPATGSLAFTGAAAAAAPAAAAGSAVFNGTAAASGPGITASGALALAGTAAARAPAAATAALSLAGTAAPRAAGAAAGAITITGTAQFVPPFTVGTLTAADAPLAVLGSSAATAGQATLTASDTRTGGPS